jgi:hypothetical protein
MSSRRFDAGFCDPRIGIGFANTADAFIGMDFHHQIVLGGAASGNVKAGLQ